MCIIWQWLGSVTWGLCRTLASTGCHLGRVTAPGLTVWAPVGQPWGSLCDETPLCLWEELPSDDDTGSMPGCRMHLLQAALCMWSCAECLVSSQGLLFPSPEKGKERKTTISTESMFETLSLPHVLLPASEHSMLITQAAAATASCWCPRLRKTWKLVAICAYSGLQ